VRHGPELRRTHGLRVDVRSRHVVRAAPVMDR
jgi:hypothetical protein